MYGYIYKTTNLINGKIYIGQHKAKKFDGKNYLGSGQIFMRALEKYGKDNFVVELLCICNTKEELNEKEIYYINLYNSKDEAVGYNILPGGSRAPGDYHHTKISKKKISEHSKQMIYITKDGKNKGVFKEELDHYLQDGWIRGRYIIKNETNQKLKRIKISEKNKNRKMYTDGSVIVKIFPEEIPEYEKRGFREGYRNKNGDICYRVTITDGIHKKTLIESYARNYEKRGWTRFPCDMEFARKHYLECHSKNKREGAKKTQKTKSFWSDEYKKAIRDKISTTLKNKPRINKPLKIGYRTIHKGDLEKIVNPDFIKTYLEEGWELGRNPANCRPAHNKGKKASEELRKKLSQSHLGQQKDNRWINNGIINKRVHKDIVNDYLKDSWKLGRIKKK